MNRLHCHPERSCHSERSACPERSEGTASHREGSAFRCFVIALLALSACGGEETPSARPQASGSTAVTVAVDTTAASPRLAGGSVVLFVGTSLTAGYGLDPDNAYPMMIQRKLDSAGMNIDVVNAGVSGETSASLLRRLDWLLRQPFEVIVIETGANDGLRGIPVEAMRDNIQKIIDGVKRARPHARIALVQMEAPPEFGNAYTRRFREVFPELARKNGVTLFPFLLDSVAGIRQLNQGDGIHPNLEGERIVARNVWRALRPLLQ